MGLENVLNEIILGQCILSIICEFVSVTCFSTLLYNLVIKKLHAHIEASPCMILYMCVEILLSFTTIAYLLYLSIFWQQKGNVYNAYWMYSVGGIQNLVMTFAPLPPFFLGLDRCFCVWMPLAYNSKKKKLVLFAALFAIFVFILICIFFRVLVNIPKSSITTCMTLGCMMSNSSGQVYTTLRYIAGIGNLLICLILIIIVRKYTFFSHKTNFLVLATLIMTFFCDLCPHLLSFLSYTFSNYNISNSLGLYSLLASAVESCCCGLIYRCSMKLKTSEIILVSKHSNKTIPSSNRIVPFSR